MGVKFLVQRKQSKSILGEKRYGEQSVGKPKGGSILGCRKYLVIEELDKGEIGDELDEKHPKKDI